jgi:hypothetical protein
MQATGLEGAKAVTQMVAILAAGEAGADYVDTPRTGEHTNAEIIEFLAEGNSRSSNPKKRPIYLDDSELQKQAEMFSDEFVRHLNQIKDLQVAPQELVQRKAKAGTIAALRKAALYQASVWARNLKRGTVTGGAAAEKVSDAYAAYRQKRYGVNPGVVFIASRQLGNAILADAKGRIKYRFNTGRVGNVLKAFRANR